MNALQTAAQQALEALEWHYRQGHSNTLGGFRLKIDEKALRALRAALAQQDEPVEPVAHFGSAYVNENGVHITTVLGPVAIPQDAKLYTAPPQRTMVPLTEEEIYHATGHCGVSEHTAIKIARAVEEASWEKNHG